MPSRIQRCGSATGAPGSFDKNVYTEPIGSTVMEAPLLAKVIVHAPGGDVVGHLGPDVNVWLVPRMLEGARCGGVVTQLGGDDVASYKRLIITVRCRA